MNSQKLEQNFCPICGSDQCNELFSLPGIPVFVNVFADSADKARSFLRGSQVLALCQNCGFVFNRNFEQEKVMYDTGYHSERGHSSYYIQHMNQVIDFIEKSKPIRGKRLLEVACGGGEFLAKAAERLPTAVIGVDPSAQEKTDGPLHIQKVLFDELYLSRMRYPVDIIINRHMIEHILNPLEMLKNFKRALSENGILYLETPRLDWILENQAFFDFPYEHCAYYTDKFIVRLLKMAGFAITAAENSYNGQYFSICAQKCDASSVLDPVPAGELRQIQESFSALRNAYMKLNSRKDIYRFCTETVRLGYPSLTNPSITGDGIYLWGAAAKGVMCANLLDKWPIAGFIDKNPYKWGKFAPGTGHQVLSPAEVMYDRVKTIIVENDVYFTEIQADVKKIDERICVIALSKLNRM